MSDADGSASVTCQRCGTDDNVEAYESDDGRTADLCGECREDVEPDASDLGHDRDIVDALSEATGYFHDDDAARLRDIAADSGMKPVGIVRAGVENEIERRERRCVHFDHDESDEYPAANAFEYYRIHKSFQLEFEAALEALPKEENQRLRKVHVLEHAAEELQDKARIHEGKADRAERYLRENGHELPEVEPPTAEGVDA